MKTDEMTSILEALIRDEQTNATARCTAIRTPATRSSGARSRSEPLPDRK
jgi:hypothetical protein